MQAISFPAAALRSLVLAAGLLAAAAPAVSHAAPSWGGEQVQGSGNIKRDARAVRNFKGLDVSVPARVELRIGNTEGVSIEADDNVLPLIETVVRDGVLEIRPARRNLNLRSHNIKIIVQARQIERLGLGGSGSLVSDTLRAPRLDLNLGGSGSIDLKGVESEAVAVSLGGSGDLKIGSGNANRLTVSIGGSGDVDAGGVRAQNANVSVAGSGEATVWARDALSMTIAGSGDVNYYGDPQVSKSVVGSGGARRLGAAPR